MPETEPPVVNKENANRKPFVIRGHHLPYFAMLVNNRYGDTYEILNLPQSLAKHIRSGIERSLDEVRYYPNDTLTIQREEEYVQDVLGKGLEQANQFENHLVRTFEAFLRLPDNHPTEIVEGVPDIICAGCTIGKHCYPNRLDITHTLVTDDTKLTDEFLSRVEGINWLSRLRRENQLPELTIQKQALFPDAEPNVRRISTTLGVVKKVLKREPNEKSTLFRLF